jgi:hypothetical protein
MTVKHDIMGTNITRVGELSKAVLYARQGNTRQPELQIPVSCQLDLWDSPSANENHLRNTYFLHSWIRYDKQIVLVENLSSYFGPFTSLNIKIWVFKSWLCIKSFETADLFPQKNDMHNKPLNNNL